MQNYMGFELRYDIAGQTSVPSHLYVSEHVIPLTLKNRMRDHIRMNRKKHDLHCDAKHNLEAIQKCTNMWWNPINSIRHQQEMLRLSLLPSSNTQVQKRRIPLDVSKLTPDHVEYWCTSIPKKRKESIPEWQFACNCGEVCSSWENYRYHPTGLMFECSRCSFWSHAHCVFGKKFTAQDIEEMPVLYCHKCMNALRRESFAADRQHQFRTEQCKENPELVTETEDLS